MVNFEHKKDEHLDEVLLLVNMSAMHRSCLHVVIYKLVPE